MGFHPYLRWETFMSWLIMMGDSMATLQANETRPADKSQRRVLLAASLFLVVGCALQWFRLQSLTASMDQGILMQALWNGLRGHPFQSTLSSQLSTNVIHSGELPSLGYHRLGQHFTPILALWIPLVGLLGKWALPMLQVVLITAAGLVLHRLAKQHLKPELAAMVSIAFYCANAVIAPCMLSNFTDLSQLPLCVFLLLLGLEQQQRWLTIAAALVVPLIREDTGVVLMGIGLWLGLRRSGRWPLAATLIIFGGGWVALATNFLMPMFSADNAQRFMVENFGQYLEGRNQASSLEVLGLVLRQPLILLGELVSPPGNTITYLMAQGLPLIMVPFLSIDSWLLMGLPLLGLLLAQGFNNPLSINIRYTYLVVPGLFAGAVFWWRERQVLFEARRLRRIWAGAIALSCFFTVTANPNQSLSWMIPDSIQPWIYRNPMDQLRHGNKALDLIKRIPKSSRVAATTGLIPHLADREVLIRFPYHNQFQDQNGQPNFVDWVAADMHNQKLFQTFRKQRKGLQRNLQQLDELLNQGYGVMAFNDDVVLLQRNASGDNEAQKAFERFSKTLQH